jgi:hypothetical protein
MTSDDSTFRCSNITCASFALHLALILSNALCLVEGGGPAFYSIS